MKQRNTDLYRIKNPIKQHTLRDLLDYNQDTGVFTWKDSEHIHARCRGKVAGGVHHSGYQTITVNNQVYQANRLAWIYVHGNLKDERNVIKHLNGILTDNRIENLICTHQRSAYKRNTDTKSVRDRQIPQKKNFVLKNSDVGYRPAKLNLGDGTFKHTASFIKDGERVYVGSFTSGREAYSAFIKQKHVYQKGLKA